MRNAGVLLHPTALPGGVLDQEVERFFAWMVAAGLSVWQMLPLGPPHCDRSPYQAYSSHALNPALLPKGMGSVPAAQLEDFSEREKWWLDDYALFVALREVHGDQSWPNWAEPFRFRDPVALDKFRRQHAERLQHLHEEQLLLWRRWDEIHAAAREYGIRLFGDVPIAVAYDSADVWAAPELFKLDAELKPTVVAGVPPDYFSATGQRWGNPHYDWERMRADDFAWWRARMDSALRQFDLVRIDHFRGLQALWEIPASEETAINGTWVETPGRELLEALRREFPELPFVAEDLGIITPEVVALREDFGLPGLSVLQFGFDGHADNPHSLRNQVENSVVYTGTHDNNTTVGWFAELDPALQEQVLAQMPQEVGPIPWPLIEAALRSVARLAVIPLQDWLGLDGRHRTNIPGTTENNWSWRFSWDQVPVELAGEIRRRVAAAERLVDEREQDE
ncbi:MAG: 4-alpha-glucanotransferase [Desulfuromonas sp.]|nr:MAG: 4-alpha-glucanotransferase [Desulfuromonas sp.]